MSVDRSTIDAMREAVRMSPDNAALRRHLGDLLLQNETYEEAENEYRHALKLSPDNAGIKLGLAEAFFLQGKNSAAFVIVEELNSLDDPPAEALMLSARLLLRSGERREAAAFYAKAVE